MVSLLLTDLIKKTEINPENIMPYDSEEDVVIAAENNYKDKLLTRKFGLNAN